MLAIKLQRIGKKHQPSYRIVVQEKREKLGGSSVEDVGWLNPLLKKHELKRDRIEHWLKIGAQPTDTVWNLLVSAGILKAPKRAVHKKAKAKKEGEAAPSAAPKAGEAPKAEAPATPADKPTA